MSYLAEISVHFFAQTVVRDLCLLEAYRYSLLA